MFFTPWTNRSDHLQEVRCAHRKKQLKNVCNNTTNLLNRDKSIPQLNRPDGIMLVPV